MKLSAFFYFLSLSLFSFLAPKTQATILSHYPLQPWSQNTPSWALEADQVFKNPAFYELQKESLQRKNTIQPIDNDFGPLGFDKTTFEVPLSLQDRVHFWEKIYTLVSQNEVLLHDAQDLKITYGIYDLSAISNHPSLSEREKKRQIRKKIKEIKKRIQNDLQTLHQLQHTPEYISSELFPIFIQFGHVADPLKFIKAKDSLRAQKGQKETIVGAFIEKGKYLAQMEKTFHEHNLPLELTRLPIVESGFKVHALSHVGALGIWQFMPQTAKRYLHLSEALDERKDPHLATLAAAKLLKKNFEVLGSWPLAITAYNHGRAGMKRAMESTQTKDLGTIISSYQSSTFGFASKNFYAEFLAVLEIERKYQEKFGLLSSADTLDFEKVHIPHQWILGDLLNRCKDLQKQSVAFLNPALAPEVLEDKLPIPASYALKVPKGTKQRCRSQMQEDTK